ncbi:Rhamnogalacturonate lyase [Thalictrum thalictroides]|uniref:Rhamnogalacturonate lyase n=1 Tax=Thalictrum thalictroides TaxID=46969 RepID=A0A7J6WA59_THATH|nr:Rhamnogalacturonate lyase [Thalictrum thalictroides]
MVLVYFCRVPRGAADPDQSRGADIKAQATICAQCKIGVSLLKNKHSRDGPAAEFFLLDSDSKYINKVLVNKPNLRQYRLGDRYAELFFDTDLVYTVGVGDYRKDWFFAHEERQ